MKDNTKLNNKKQSRVFKDKKKLGLAMLLTKLRQYSADEMADMFGISRQSINYQMKKEKKGAGK